MKSFFKSLPLRIHTKISILAVLLVLFLVSSRSIVTLRAERKRVRRESEERAAILTRVLSVMMLQALREGDFSRLISTVKILVEEENSDIVRMRITKISETTGKEIEITDAQNPRFSNRDRQTFSPEKPQEIKGPSGVSGYIYTEFSLERFHAEMSVMRNQALVILGVFLVLGILGSILLSRLITKPIEQFEQAAQVIARGDLSAEVNYSSQDELGRLARSFNEMILGLKQIEKARIYLSHSAWMEVQRSSGTNLYLGGEARDVTVMFADVCGFTTLSEQLPPKEVVSVLNEYFGVIVDTIVKHKGVLDKFMGDCAMAVFYSPSLEESARNAVLCALEIQDNMAELERNRVFYQKTTVNVGIGINSGRVVSGNIGSSRRMEYTVIGDTVNIASRLEKLSKKGRHTRIIVGQKTHDFLEDLIEFVELPSTTLKGKKELLSIYEVRKLRELDDLLTNIKSEDPSLKQNSIKVLGRSNNPEAIPYLLELLLDNDPSIRMAVTVALSRLLYFPLNTVTRSRVKDAIVHAAETETDTKVLATLIQAI
ncbi:MAG: adenylate/guanylate cyclase domain-containing protein, partial [bacterium]|nr:adenylate/guanylate cyclase domain-containing protein [bacterium]